MILKNLGYVPERFEAPKKNGFFELEDNSAEREAVCQKFMEEDLAKSGLKQEDMYTSPDPYTDDYTLAAYRIPYHDLEGRPIRDGDNHSRMFRRRLLHSPTAPSVLGKYNAPSREQEPLLCNIPYIPRDFRANGGTLYICEGEKKSVAVAKYLGVDSIGIGGCWNWMEKRGSKRIHPWIKAILEHYDKVVVIPDGDIERYDINKAYGQFAGELRRLEKDVTVLKPPGKIDDLFMEWDRDSKLIADEFAKIPELEQMVYGVAELVEQYDLSFAMSAKGDMTIHQTTNNVMRLLEGSNLFPEIWRNLDNNTIFIGEEPLTVGATEMEIANFFQHYFQMPRVNSKMVRECITSLAVRNERSPYKEWLLSLEWDGTPRLDTWMNRLWGVEMSDYVGQASARWVMSSVARIMEPGCKVDWMLVTVGGQGVGKTTMPDVLFDGHTVPCVGKQSDTDIKLTLHSGLCAVVDEMDALYKGESTFWKSLITLQQDYVRAPYSPNHEWKTRRFVLYGTTNVHTWLPSDHSGYRRYVSVNVGDNMLQLEELKQERDQLWAEAVHRWRAGECYWEVEGATEIAEEEYSAESPIEEKVNDFMEYIRSSQDATVCALDSKGDLVFSMSQFLEWAGYTGPGMARNTHLTKEVSAVLTKLGAKRVKRSGRRGYCVPLQPL